MQTDQQNYEYTITSLALHFGLDYDRLRQYMTNVPQVYRYHLVLEQRVVAFLKQLDPGYGKLDESYLTRIGFLSSSTKMRELLHRSQEESERGHVDRFDLVIKFVEDEFYNEEHLQRLDPWKGLMSPDTSSVSQTTTTENDTAGVFFYHGTNTHSASNIRQNGIRLSEGRQRRDFSCGYGFYIFRQFDHAFSWAKNTSRKPAVVIFHFDPSRFNVLDLTDAEDDWYDLVQTFRNCRRTAAKRRELRDKKVDFIMGKMARRKEDKFEQIPYSPLQFCIVSETMANTIWQNNFISVCC